MPGRNSFSEESQSSQESNSITAEQRTPPPPTPMIMCARQPSAISSKIMAGTLDASFDRPTSIEALIQQQVEARVEQIQEEMEQRLEQQVQRLREEMEQKLKEQIQQIRKDLEPVKKVPLKENTNTHPVATHTASHRTLGPRKGAHPAKR